MDLSSNTSNIGITLFIAVTDLAVTDFFDTTLGVGGSFQELGRAAMAPNLVLAVKVPGIRAEA
jgi:hypothetical protein